MARKGGAGEGESRIASGVGRGAAAARLNAMRSALSHELVRAGQVLERRGMIVATEGNLSARLSPDRLLITRRGRRKGNLTTRDFVELSLAEPENSQPRLAASTEHRMHLAVYAARPDVEAVVHAHPVGLSAFAVRGAIPDVGALDEARAFVKRIGLVPYWPSGTEDLARGVAAALGLSPETSSGEVLILRSHGALAVGASVEEALSRLEIAEHLAITLFHAERGGR